jgi:hypothetical protein
VAIKGKGRTKSRQPARAPRSVPVRVRPPFFLRRWVQVALAFLAGTGAAAAVVWGFVEVRERDRRDEEARDRETASRAASQWQATVDGALQGVGIVEPGQPPIVFTGLRTVVDQMAKGETAKDAAGVAERAHEDATAAIETLDAVNLSDLLRDQGLNEAETIYFLNSQEGLVSGLQVYERVAALAGEAAAARDPGTARAIAREAKALLPVANSVFEDAWFDYQEALGRVGLAAPSVPGLGG